jgi:general L-amino acid transport system permease protein
MTLSILSTRRARRSLVQGLFLLFILVMAVLAVENTRQNLAAQGITSGFAFLKRSTAWNIGFSLIPYTPSDTYLKAILVGALNTLFLAGMTLPVATAIGIGVALLRLSTEPALKTIGVFYVETFRNIPVLLQLVFWYSILIHLPQPRNALVLFDAIYLSGRGLYFPWLASAPASWIMLVLSLLVAAIVSVLTWLMPFFRRFDDDLLRLTRRGLWLSACGVGALALWLGRAADQPFLSIPALNGLSITGGFRISPELTACAIALSIYGGAYIAEIMRAGFNAVPKGQGEAGFALGLSRRDIFRRIRLPLAIRMVLPTLTNQYVWLMKGTTIGIAVGFADLFMIISTAISQAGQTLELIAILMGTFLAINFTLAWVLNRINDAIKLKGSQLRISP